MQTEGDPGETVGINRPASWSGLDHFLGLIFQGVIEMACQTISMIYNTVINHITLQEFVSACMSVKA